MGITNARHLQHINTWKEKFQNYKLAWIKNLFRHEPVESAIRILAAGQLLSRAAASATDSIQNDIAPDDIIQNRDDAHEYVRLYFRPRTPTQYHIEGIRKPADYYMGRHGGFLVMMVFNGASVLTLPEARFSTANMQSPYSVILDGDDGFDQLDFAGIYHDEAYPSDDQRKKRCAEVLLSEPLSIRPHLSALVVRTDADMATLKYLLSRENLDDLIPLVRKSDGSGIFFNFYTAVKYVDPAPGRYNFELAPTKSGIEVDAEVYAYNDSSGEKFRIFKGSLKPITKYYTTHKLPAGEYRLLFKLEGCYAHESKVFLPQLADQ